MFNKIDMAISAAILALWVSLPFAMQALILLVIVDLFFCLINQRKSLWDFGRKDMVALVLCYLVYLLSAMAKNNGATPMIISASAAVPLFYSLVVGISIMKSASDMGVPIPPKAIDLFNKIEGLTTAEKQDLANLNNKQRNSKDSPRTDPGQGDVYQ